MAEPLPSPGANWLVFNGEIYNFLHLRRELEALGHRFRTGTDSEVILHAYREWGVSCIERMRGMFAWCLLDGTSRRAWFCRDPLGVKPLYLFRPEGGGLLFASEVRTLLAAGPGLVPPRADPQAIEAFLAQGAVWGDSGFIHGVTSLEPGGSLETSWSGVPTARRTYWKLGGGDVGDAHSPKDLRDGGRREAVDRLGSTLRESVRLGLISDVPLGLFLSAGVDSNSILALAAEVGDRPLETTCLGFDAAGFDETGAAAAVASEFGARHTSFHLSQQEALNSLEDVLAAIDRPTTDGFNSFFICRAARQAGLTVALSGLGGDELFGGYDSFREISRAARLMNFLGGKTWIGAGLGPFAGLAGGRRGIKAREMFRRSPDLLSIYLLRREKLLPRERRSLWERPGASDPASGIPLELVEKLARCLPAVDPINQVGWLEASTFMTDMLLRDTDVMSMRHGLEVRVPLLDREVVGQAMALPGAWKVPDPRLKPLLVDAVGSRLPPRSYRAPKSAFELPWDAWLRGRWAGRAVEAMNCREAWKDIGFDPDVPLRFWERFLAGDPRITWEQILSLVVLADFVVRHRIRTAA